MLQMMGMLRTYQTSSSLSALGRGPQCSTLESSQHLYKDILLSVTSLLVCAIELLQISPSGLSTLQTMSWKHIRIKFQERKVILHFFPAVFKEKTLKLVLLEWPLCSLIHTIWQQDNERKSSREEPTIPYEMNWWWINSHFGLISSHG